MNKLTLALSCLMAAIVQPALASDDSTLLFSNGDSISGKWLGYQDAKIAIRSPYFSQDSTSFSSTSLLEAQLPAPLIRQPETPTANHIATLTLEDRYGYPNERDKIKGAIIDISKDFVTLSTAFAGIVKVDKTLIYSISAAPVEQVLYDGPHAIDEWELHTEDTPWSLKNQTFTSSEESGGISKDLKLTAKSMLSFDVKWTDSPRLTLYLYADSSKQNTPQNYYALKINNSRVSMSRISDHGQFNNLSRIPEDSREGIMTNTAHLALYMDQRKGLFHLFSNDQHVTSFQDSAPLPTKLGTAVHFRNQRDQKFQIKNIRAIQWRGKSPIIDPTTSDDTLTGEGDLIHLANGDTMRGILGDVTDGFISVKTPHASFQIPLAGISVLMQRTQRENQARADVHDVRAHFHDGGWIIIDVTQIDTTHIFGNNEALGDCQFRLDAFKKIDFNIYSRSHNTIRKKLSW